VRQEDIKLPTTDTATTIAARHSHVAASAHGAQIE
jgi:hypothetical protein